MAPFFPCTLFREGSRASRGRPGGQGATGGFVVEGCPHSSVAPALTPRPGAEGGAGSSPDGRAEGARVRSRRAAAQTVAPPSLISEGQIG